MCDEQKLDPAVLTGSYAGAMGYGQFIPSSYRNFAVDHDQDGVADIWTNPADAIASVANYFTKHGWKYGESVAFQLGEAVAEEYISPALAPNLTVKALREAKIKVPDTLDDSAMVTLMKHVTPEGDEYWLGLENFYVITRYNHSSMYALAVFQLSELLKAKVDAE